MNDKYAELLSASTLIGDKITNAEGDNLGNLEELMIDLPSGHVAYAVLSFGGFLGLGEKLFAIPWEAIGVDQDRERLILDVEPEELEDAPGFEEENWPGTPGPDYIHQVYGHYGYKPYWLRGVETDVQRTRILSGTTVMGDKVVNDQGEDLGEIEELMIDLDEGTIAYSVLSFGGTAGIGEKLFAIPWQALTIDQEREVVVLNVDKETLEDAPGFNKDDWPEAPGRDYVIKVYDYYGYETYWNR